VPLKSGLSRIVTLSCAIVPLLGMAQNGSLTTTFTNAAPTALANLGWSVAALGTDRVLVGAPGDDTGAENAGAAYLFKTNGTLLMNLTNPIPKTGAAFGEAVTAVGGDRVLIGARYADQAGAAYLFGTNGALLASFTNPNPASVLSFGASVASMGTDRVLIGADGYDTGVTNAGAVYLFSTNRSLLTTLTNPHPGNNMFGHSVAAVLGDKVLVGAPWDDTGAVHSGTACLFSTNGTLLTNFANPTPGREELFGVAVAAAGSDRVIITASFDDLGAENTGAAYLFSSNGTLLATFTSPNPTPNAQFGYSVAMVGGESVLIGALDDAAGGTSSGAAYLFNTNGVLLNTFTNPAASPTPEQYAGFGGSVAALGTDQLIIGAPYEDSGAMDAGAAYLFDIPPPSLRIRLTPTNAVTVSWPSPSGRFTPQQNARSIAAANWSNVTEIIQDDGTNREFIVSPPTGDTFYRLLRP
jgi:hypothetical protein